MTLCLRKLRLSGAAEAGSRSSGSLCRGQKGGKRDSVSFDRQAQPLPIRTEGMRWFLRRRFFSHAEPELPPEIASGPSFKLRATEFEPITSVATLLSEAVEYGCSPKLHRSAIGQDNRVFGFKVSMRSILTAANQSTSLRSCLRIALIFANMKPKLNFRSQKTQFCLGSRAICGFLRSGCWEHFRRIAAQVPKGFSASGCRGHDHREAFEIAKRVVILGNIEIIKVAENIAVSFNCRDGARINAFPPSHRRSIVGRSNSVCPCDKRCLFDRPRAASNPCRNRSSFRRASEYCR